MVHFTLYTLYSLLHTPHSTLDTRAPTPYTAHCTLHAARSTTYTYNLHFTLYTAHCTLHTPHSTLYSPHSQHFKPYRFTLCAFHFFRPSQLCTFHTSRCLEPWPSFICHLARALTLRPQLPLFHCVTSFRASKGPLPCPRWTFESSPITCHYVGFGAFPHPLRAAVHADVFSSSSLLTNIASICTSGCSPCLHAPASDPLVHIDVKIAQLKLQHGHFLQTGTFYAITMCQFANVCVIFMPFCHQ